MITGATGMVGKGVLLEALEQNDIEEIVLLSRKTIGYSNPKIKEVIVSNFKEVGQHADKFKGMDACFYCMGISSVGLKEKEYSEITYDLTKIVAETLFSESPDSVFIYVSGVGTDSSEKGKSMWARVKGRTENMVLNMGFKDAYAFRPGAIIPVKGVKSKTKWVNALYVVFWPFFPLFRLSKSVVSSSDVGKAMLVLVENPVEEKVVNPNKIKILSKK